MDLKRLTFPALFIILLAGLAGLAYYLYVPAPPETDYNQTPNYTYPPAATPSYSQMLQSYETELKERANTATVQSLCNTIYFFNLTEIKAFNYNCFKINYTYADWNCLCVSPFPQ